MKTFCSVIASILLVGCTANNYGTGDGEYSYMRADFVLAHTVTPNKIDYALTDNGDSIVLNPQITSTWASVSDTLYRALLYYNDNGATATPVNIIKVSVLKINNKADVSPIYTDPVTLNSAWIGKNKKYLNINFLIKTGQNDGVMGTQSIGMVCDTITTNADGTHDIYLSLMHNQNNVPQYYSAQEYAGIPLTSLSTGDKIHLSVNTYSGVVESDFTY